MFSEEFHQNSSEINVIIDKFSSASMKCSTFFENLNMQITCPSIMLENSMKNVSSSKEKWNAKE